MKQAIRRQPLEITTEPTKKANKIICNIMFGVVVAIALLMAISLATYHPEDSAWSKTVATAQSHNWLGARGAFFSDILFTAVGEAAWLVPAVLIAYGYRLICQSGYKGLDIETIIVRIVGVALMLLAIASLLNVYNPNDALVKHGGAVGQLVATLLGHSVGWLQNLFPDSFVSVTVSKIVLFFLLFMATMMASGCGPLIWIDTIGAMMIKSFQEILGLFKPSRDDDNSNLSNIEHLMTKEAEPAIASPTQKLEEPTEPKSRFFSKFIKSKEKTTEEATTSEHSHAEPQFSDSNHKKSNAHKTEPSFGFGATNTDKAEPNFTHSTDTNEHHNHSEIESTITPKFEPQVDENGQPKLPSIFKRPTIKSAPQDTATHNENTRFKNLSDWVDEPKDEEPLVMPASMFAHTTSSRIDTVNEAPAFNIFAEKSEPIIPSKIFVEPTAMTDSSSGQSMFSQTNSFADQRTTPAFSTANPHEDEQDFNAFLEELEKYHPPHFSDEPTLSNTEEMPMVTESFTMDDLPQVEMISEVPEKEIDLPQVTEYIEDSYNQKFEPAFNNIVESTITEPEIETVAMPTWAPFEPIEEPQEIPAFNLWEEAVEETVPEPILVTPAPVEPPKQNIVMPTPRIPEKMSPGQKAELLKHFPMAGQLPPLNLLGDPPPSLNQYDVDELNDMAQLIEDQLKNFSIRVKVANIEPGPVVTRFELDLAPGVKVAQINNLEKDIARGLSVTSVRVVDIIPGTSYVGLEIPNRKREIVYFKSGLESQEYQDAKDPLTLI
ncbi:MAG: DNA translocase FtsK 4TM domain-containing protein, partial [Wohlfahrtiimonas sp.]